MSWSHIRCFYPFTLNIKKTTPILKKYLFAYILSYSYQTQKIWLKKVYLTCNISKSNRDFHSIFFLSDAENRLWWYYQKDFRILRKFQTWFFPLLGTLCAAAEGRSGTSRRCSNLRNHRANSDLITITKNWQSLYKIN